MPFDVYLFRWFQYFAGMVLYRCYFIQCICLFVGIILRLALLKEGGYVRTCTHTVTICTYIYIRAFLIDIDIFFSIEVMSVCTHTTLEACI